MIMFINVPRETYKKIIKLLNSNFYIIDKRDKNLNFSKI